MEEKVTFEVEDLCCDSCIDGCFKILEKVPGINSIKFYFCEENRNNEIDINYNSNKITVDNIKKAIESYGNGQVSFYKILNIKYYRKESGENGANL